jgi:hypothetical protein
MKFSSPSSICATCPAHLSLWFDHKTSNEYKSWSSSLRNFLHPPVISADSGPSSFLNTPHSSLNMTDQVSH